IYENESKYPIIPPLLETVELYRKRKELAPGLGNSNGEEWYKLRKVVQYIMLRPQVSLDYLPAQNQVADDFVKLMPSLITRTREIPNFNQWIARWGIESSANNCLDRRMGFLEERGMNLGDTIINNNSKVFSLSTKLYFALPIYKIIPTPSLIKFFEAEDSMNSIGRKLLDEALLEYDRTVKEGKLTEGRFRFLTYMLKNESVSHKDLTAVVLSVLTDTLSTTTQALLFNLYNLAAHETVQTKAYEEAKTILQPSGCLTAEGFNASMYIKACIKETFRLFPTGLDIQRLSPKNMVIGGYQIPENTYLCLNNHIQLLNPKVIPNPERFSPERWLREDGETDKLHPYLLTPFSLGRRMCAGRRFAEQELVMMIAKILTQFKMEWHHEKLKQRFRILQFPDQEVKITFSPRDS
ncbi:cytochrome P450 CYP44, partial [Biomphalaria glabrata]